MLWVLKITVSMRRFFGAPNTNAKDYGQENIYNFTQKIFAYLNLCTKYSLTGQDKLNFERKIVNIFLLIILNICFGC